MIIIIIIDNSTVHCNKQLSAIVFLTAKRNKAGPSRWSTGDVRRRRGHTTQLCRWTRCMQPASATSDEAAAPAAVLVVVVSWTPGPAWLTTRTAASRAITQTVEARPSTPPGGTSHGRSPPC